MVLFLGLVLLLLILVSVLLIGTLINIKRGHRNSGQRPSCSAVHFPSRGRARWVGRRRWPLSRRSQNSKGVSFYFPCIFFWVNEFYSFFKSMGFSLPLGMLVAKWVPTPCCNDAYSVGTLNGHCGRKAGKSIMRPRFPPHLGRFFLVSKRTFDFPGGFFGGCFISGGPGILGLALAMLSLVRYPLNLLMLVGGLLSVIWLWIPVLSFLPLLSTG